MIFMIFNILEPIVVLIVNGDHTMLLTKLRAIMFLIVIILLAGSTIYSQFQVTNARRLTKKANKTVAKVCIQVKAMGDISTKKRSVLSDLKRYRKVMALCVK